LTDQVKHPPHYTAYPIEVIRSIKIILESIPDITPFEAYCLGNEIKYSFRAGLKDDAQQDIEKAMQYKKFREEL